MSAVTCASLGDLVQATARISNVTSTASRAKSDDFAFIVVTPNDVGGYLQFSCRTPGFSEKILRQRNSSAPLVKKLIVQNRSGKFVLGRLLGRVLHSRNPALAKHFTVFLARDFLGHFEHHLDQSVLRKALRTTYQGT